MFRCMLYGEITTLEPDFPGSGAPTLKVRGLNMLHRLRDKQRSDAYNKKRDSDIAKKIAKRIKIEIEVSKNYAANEEPVEFIFQNNKYDIVFLMERAKSIGYELYVDPDKKKLVFKPSTQGSKTYKLDWNRSLLNFRPTLTTANQVKEVKVTGWNPKKKKPRRLTTGFYGYPLNLIITKSARPVNRKNSENMPTRP